jgi:hypothetical protein
MTKLRTKYLRIRWEPRWPAFAIGFYGGKYRRQFIVLIAPLVIEIGKDIR